jgi:transcriptional regulator with XRE-family HTH domain
MLERGASIDEIAAEMRARFTYGVRAAYRHAAGLTLEQVAERYNGAAGDADARTTGPRISEWESWPQGGRRPIAFNLITLAHVFGTDPGSLITVDEEALLDERERILLRELHAARRKSSSDMPLRQVTSSPSPTTEVNNSRLAPADAAAQSLEFAAWAESSNVGSSALEHLNFELSRIAVEYVHAPLLPLYRDLVMLRDSSFALLKGHQSPREAGELFFLTGTTCVLLAHASQNFGDDAAAMAHIRAAWACAEQSDHDGLRAWVRGTAALIAEWSNQQRRALEYTKEGQRYAASTDSRVRLAAIEARAAAWIGDRHRAMAALDATRRARESPARSDEFDEFGGVLSFPLPKQLCYAGTTYLLLGEADLAQRHALDAIAGYESGPETARSYGDESLARLDLAAARVALGDLDGAHDAITPVLALPAELRIHQLGVGLARVRAALAAPQFARATFARSLAEQLDEFRVTEAARSLRPTQRPAGQT